MFALLRWRSLALKVTWDYENRYHAADILAVDRIF